MESPLFFCYTPMHEVVPKVVAMAVRTVMRMFRIFWISSFLFMVVESFSGWFFCNWSPPWKGARGMLTLHSFISSEWKT